MRTLVLLLCAQAAAAAPLVRVVEAPAKLNAAPQARASVPLPLPVSLSAAAAKPGIFLSHAAPTAAAAAPQAGPSATLNAAAAFTPKAADASERELEGQAFWRQALSEGSAGAVAGQASTAWQERLPGAVVETGAETERLLEARKKGVKISKELATSDTKTITEYSGVPSRVEELKDYARVYRHYIRNKADLDAILAGGMLKAGPVSYVEFTGSSRAYIKDIYPDVHGIFFTSPEKSSGEPRVMNEAVPHWIDFRIPPGVRAVSLDGSDVLMLPIERESFVPVLIVGSSAGQ
jgi:hypothetical protein